MIFRMRKAYACECNIPALKQIAKRKVNICFIGRYLNLFTCSCTCNLQKLIWCDQLLIEFKCKAPRPRWGIWDQNPWLLRQSTCLSERIICMYMWTQKIWLIMMHIWLWIKKCVLCLHKFLWKRWRGGGGLTLIYCFCRICFT